MRIRVLALLSLLLAAAPSALAQKNGDDVSIGKYHTITSKVFGEERTVLIHLPEGYETSADKYPVLYVLGGSASNLVEGVQATTQRGVPQMIVVAIATTGYRLNSNRDLVPGGGSDGAEKYLRFISEELFPYVEQRFRVENHRTLYGASAMGVFVLHTLLEQPEAFAGYIASSPAVAYQYDYMAAKATNAARPRPRRNTRLYVVYGDKESPELREGIAKYRPLLEALRSDTLSIAIEDLPQETHVPGNSLSKGLKQIFDGYLYPYERLLTDGLPALESHYDKLSQRLGFRIPVPQLDLTRLTIFLMENGKSADLKAMARALERANSEGRLHHPDPGGLVHLVLVIAHFRANELDLMKEHYRQLQLPKGWTPEIADWPKIVEAAKEGKNDAPGPRKRPATGPATR
jgi:predicted alpha/beta superfamily hydrolase